MTPTFAPHVEDDPVFRQPQEERAEGVVARIEAAREEPVACEEVQVAFETQGALKQALHRALHLEAILARPRHLVQKGQDSASGGPRSFLGNAGGPWLARARRPRPPCVPSHSDPGKSRASLVVFYERTWAASGTARRRVSWPRVRRHGPGAAATDRHARSAAALPGRQLVERRRQRGARRFAQRQLHQLHRGDRRRLHPDFGGDATRRTTSTAWSTRSSPEPQPLEPVTSSSIGGESDVGAPGRPAGLSDSGRRRRPSRSGSRAVSPAACDPTAIATCCSSTGTTGSSSSSTTRYWNGTPVAGRVGRGLPARQQPPPARGLDERRRRRPRHPARASSATTRSFGADPIRHAFRVTVRDTNGYVFPASHTAGIDAGRPAHGRAPAAQGRHGHLELPRRRAEDLPGDEDLRPDRGRQRLGHVRDRGLRPNWTSPVVRGAGRGSTPRISRSSSSAGSPRPRRPPSTCASTPLSPCRLLDTRNAAGPYGGPAIPPSGERIFKAIGQCGIPATAKAISVNAAVVLAPGPGNLTFYPGDLSAPAPATSTSPAVRPGPTAWS